MTTMQNARPVGRARADSLSRMLELEQKYKLQRLQDNDSTPPLIPLGRANTRSASSAQPDPALKARRASAHPPVSHQNTHMIMKTIRRNSGLPPLSISVPPSLTSTSVLAVRARDPEAAFHALGSPGSRPTDTLERGKTVTFSEPEEDDDDASDQSSICQSPSWQVYGQKKQKSKKGETAQKKKQQERQGKALKDSAKKRLNKVGPPINPEVRPAQSDRSVSAPELAGGQKPGDRLVNRSTSHYPPDSMTNHHNHPRQPPAEANTKPKSKGLFSSFRFSSSNTPPAQKVQVEDSNNSMEDAGSFRSVSAFPEQMQGLRGDTAFLNPRKPPSIMSTQSTSTQSQSSQERQAGKSRKSFGHGRSNSLLAKIRGPSYLYAKSSEPTEEEEEEVVVASQQPESLGHFGARPIQLAHSQELNQPALAAHVIQKTEVQHVNITRGRQALAHIIQPRDSSSDYEDARVTDSCRQHHVQPPVSDAPIANEGRRRPPTHVGQTRSQHQDLITVPPPIQANIQTDDQNNRVRETRRNFPSLNQPKMPIYHQVAVLEHPTPTISPESDKSYATVYTDAVDRLSESHSPYIEHVPFSSSAQTSVTRPGSSTEDRGKLESPCRPPESAVPQIAELKETSRAGSQDAGVIKRSRRSPKKLVTSIDQQLQTAESQAEPQHHTRQKSADYFAFISESYAPPSLELRSPIEEDFRSFHSMEEKMTEDEYGDIDLIWTETTSQGPKDGVEDSSKAIGKPSQTDSLQDDRLSESCDSPTLSAHDDVSIKVEDKAQIPGPSLEEEPSQSVSERSYSSTYNDPFYSPSTATTPDISRPQSQAGASVDEARPMSNSVSNGYDKTIRRLHRSKVLELSQRSANQVTLERGAPPNRKTGSIKSEDSHNGTPTSPQPKYIAQSPSMKEIEMLKEGSEMPEEMAEITPIARRQHLPPKAHSAIDLGESVSSFPGKNLSK
ncbi:hypothetical protein BKA67DRAFT_196286 [Truncatella angustata]|uniref:Uncharacterized protein n=1 Tax=Truncatella angustata TaxID=152316 RepID=A0A9P8USW0_9PEZI|nr:uncharacterized protein BKA67DRAFT_196286 [Truncatella angustata]KAH6657718.1 hypothetical protein BKA67DRAFT_196286 [Truncatella angustata]